MTRYRGLIVGLLFLAAAVIFGFISKNELLPPRLLEIERGIIRNDTQIALMASALSGLVGIFPGLIALVALWIAFIRVDVRERFLWTAIMIVSSLNIAELLDAIIDVPNKYGFLKHGVYFINAPILCGAIAYLALFVGLARDSERPSFALIPLLALIYVVVAPIVTSMVSWATLICTLFAAVGMWLIGVWIAESVGFDVYGEANADVVTG